MIITTLESLCDYKDIHSQITVLSNYLQSSNYKNAQNKIVIDKENLFINVSNNKLSPIAPPLEVHRQYIDIHIPISSTETYGWRSLKEMTSKQILPNEPFNIEKDYALYSTVPEKYFTLYPGECCIFLPDDAHAPNIGYGEIHKLIVKIKI